MEAFTIAIDGPTGAGKTCLARALAKNLGLMHLDTGAMYRALGLAALKAGIAPASEVGAVIAWLPKQKLEVKLLESGQRLLVNGEDLTDQLRTPEVSMAASDISKISEVRRFLVAMQQDLATQASFVLEGRDIGTVVLPKASLKLFVTAKPELRAQRRYQEYRASGLDCAYEEVYEDLLRRDRQDSGRADSPLRPAEDAIFLDSSDLTLDQTIDRVMALAKAVRGERPA